MHCIKDELLVFTTTFGHFCHLFNHFDTIVVQYYTIIRSPLLNTENVLKQSIYFEVIRSNWNWNCCVIIIIIIN